MGATTVRIARRLMVVGEDIILPIRGLSNISLPCVKGGDEVRVGGIVSKKQSPTHFVGAPFTQRGLWLVCLWNGRPFGAKCP